MSIFGGNNDVVSVGILGDVQGDNVDNSNNSYIDYSLLLVLLVKYFQYGTNSNGIGGVTKSILNGAVTTTNTNLNRTTWIGCHSSVHWQSGTNIVLTASDRPHSNHAILARLLRKYNDTTQEQPGLGGELNGGTADIGTWDGSDGSKPVWLPSIVNKRADSVIDSKLNGSR